MKKVNDLKVMAEQIWETLQLNADYISETEYYTIKGKGMAILEILEIKKPENFNSWRAQDNWFEKNRCYELNHFLDVCELWEERRERNKKYAQELGYLNKTAEELETERIKLNEYQENINEQQKKTGVDLSAETMKIVEKEHALKYAKNNINK